MFSKCLCWPQIWWWPFSLVPAQMMFWCYVSFQNYYIKFIRTSVTTVLIESSYRNLEHVLLPFAKLQDLNCGVLRFLITSLMFWSARSSRHHQSGTAAPNTIATIVKEQIHFMECTIKDSKIWNLPHPPMLLIKSSKCAPDAAVIVIPFSEDSAMKKENNVNT